MTVSVQICEDSYTADGAATPRSIGFQLIDPTHLTVEVDGEVQTQGIDYYVTGDYAAGTGSIQPLVAWANGAEVRYYRDTPSVQQYDIESGVPIKSVSMELELDRQALRSQEHGEALARALLVPRGESAEVLPSAADRAGKFLAFDANGNPVSSNGTGADLGLREDLAEETGAALIGTAPFSKSIIPDGSNVQQAFQALEDEADAQGAAIDALESDIIPLNEGGDAGLAALASYGKDEARTAIGLQENKRITMSTNGKNYILNAEDIAPAIHYGLVSAGQTVRLDVAGMRFYHPYVVINESAVGGIVELDCGAELHFRGDGISPSDATQTVVKLFPSHVAILRRTGGNRINIEIPDQGYWITSSAYKYRRLRDGTYEVIFTRTSSISGVSESTSNNIDTALNLTNAQVASIAVNPKSDGSAPPDFLPQVTKMGTTHALNAYQFAIRNPNAGAISHPIVVRFIGVTGP